MAAAFGSVEGVAGSNCDSQQACLDHTRTFALP
jgi:hypothetical protein